jgi:hypothetical protein
VSDAILTTCRVLLSVGAIILALGYHLFHAGQSRIRKQVYNVALVLCAVAAFYLYLELGPQFRNVRPESIMNPHDFFHYYVSAKYYRELGYYDLYECSLIADWETRKAIEPTWWVRDLRTYRYRTAEDIARDPRRCRELFSDERWREFRGDVEKLSSLMAPTRWNEVLKDKGYNATPIWNKLAEFVTNLLPLHSTAALYALLSFDYVYTVVAIVVVAATFGWHNGLLVLVFWSLNFMGAPGFVKGSLSRLDWLACLVIALCLIRRGRYASAGVAAAVAGGLRVFPALFFVGLFFKFLWTAARTRSWPRPYLRFGVAKVLTIGLLVGLTSLTGAGRRDWKDFVAKITIHDEQIAGYRVGFKYAMIDPDAKGPGQSPREQLESRQALRWLGVILALAAVFVAAPRLEDHATLGLSFLCVFFLTAPTFYYYQMLVVPFMMFLLDPQRPGQALGMSELFAWNVLAYTLRLTMPLGLKLSHVLSWTLVALCLLLFAHAALGARAREPLERGTAPG